MAKLDDAVKTLLLRGRLQQTAREVLHWGKDREEKGLG